VELELAHINRRTGPGCLGGVHRPEHLQSSYSARLIRTSRSDPISTTLSRLSQACQERRSRSGDYGPLELCRVGRGVGSGQLQ
jgi:hypothetical protein